MKNITKPSFLTFIAGAIIMMIGVFMSTGENPTDTGKYFIYAGIGLIGIFWIWSIAMVLGADDLKPYQKRFWMIAVVAVPVMGGLVFHLMHNKAGRITT